jgi:hypothetical protein
MSGEDACEGWQNHTDCSEHIYYPDKTYFGSGKGLNPPQTHSQEFFFWLGILHTVNHKKIIRDQSMYNP